MSAYKKKTTTIYDIAKTVGLSPGTVSKALNRKGNLSEETRAKVLEVAKELNYMPNPAARYLKKNRTNQIMLSISNMRDSFFLDIIETVQERAKLYDYSIMINFTGDDVQEELKTLKNLGSNFIDGIIMVTINYTQKHFDVIKTLKKPVVLCSMANIPIDNAQLACDYVCVDTRKGIYLATNHLISLGHKEIGYVGIQGDTQTGWERLEGFRTAMKDAGLTINKNHVLIGEANDSVGYNSGVKIANMKKRPTAICAAADILVMGLYKAFDEFNIRIPQDISIIGMDNIYIDSIMKPKVSSVDLSQKEIGRIAARMLFDKIFDQDQATSMANVVFQPTLVARESSAKITK
jgi:LacI family transcriptional regulator